MKVDRVEERIIYAMWFISFMNAKQQVMTSSWKQTGFYNDDQPVSNNNGVFDETIQTDECDCCTSVLYKLFRTLKFSLSGVGGEKCVAECWKKKALSFYRSSHL